MIEQTLRRITKNRFSLRYTWVIAEQADGMRLVGRIPHGLALIEEALALSANDEERWCISELLRIKAGLLTAQGGTDAVHEAEKCLLEALDWAHRQDTPSWELRAAISLHQLRSSTGRRTDHAEAVVRAVYARFSQGFATSDLLEAANILNTRPRTH
jgi:predicted ATPase